MTEVLWFLAGLALLPAGFGLVVAYQKLVANFRWWYSRPVDMSAKTLAFKRSLIVALTLEVLDASHVRAVRLPFNRLFVFRSNPHRQYDILGKEWVVIGSDFKNTEQLIGKALDELGYKVEVDSNE